MGSVRIYGITPEVFETEVANPLGLEGLDARRRLGKAGMIRGRLEAGQMRWAIRPPLTVPGVGRPRLVVVEPELSGDRPTARADDPVPLPRCGTGSL